ncbi:zinc finger, RING/FYVE/PHD-type [Artemisia annua]|uniref:Zinc finger, RING/FYVE/PHD-type n=1 Tax=Artemisia annua TaxID=35608 RepID=A0A2U1NF39_ARTAN|nr:zinc finger, RING/FYVE/PHD-type [Artemisia annua]
MWVSGVVWEFSRFLVKPSSRNPDEFDNVSALQGQLQQLFTLHDSGVDQSFIDTLPVFDYKSIIVETASSGPFSLQFLLSQNVVGNSKPSETGCDDQEIQSCNNSDPQVAPARSQSFARRSLLWLMGRQKNNVVHSNVSTNV